MHLECKDFVEDNKNSNLYIIFRICFEKDFHQWEEKVELIFCQVLHMPEKHKFFPSHKHDSNARDGTIIEENCEMIFN